MNVNDVSGQVLGAATKVHSALGPGLLESAYEACLEFELRRRALTTSRQVLLPVVYDGFKVDAGYRIDLLVNNAVLVELKSVEKLLPIHRAQTLSYLRLAASEWGY